MSEIALERIFSELKKDEWISHFLSKDEERRFLGVYDKDAHLVRLFEQMKSGKFRELDADRILDEIVDYLKTKVNVEAFLRDTVSVQIQEDIMDLFGRIHGKQPKVKEKKGCYRLEVYGKKGKPFELWSREP